MHDVLPEEPPPVRLMNTIWADRLGVHDALTTAGDLRAWLAALHDDADRRSPGRAGARDLRRFRALRDALRALATVAIGDTRPIAEATSIGVGEAVATVNDAAALPALSPQLSLRDGELRRVTVGRTDPVNLALSSIARQAIDLLTGEQVDGRASLRACYAPGCVLYFVKDHPRREWCSTACGNRARAARHYERHHKKTDEV